MARELKPGPPERSLKFQPIWNRSIYLMQNQELLWVQANRICSSKQFCFLSSITSKFPINLLQNTQLFQNAVIGLIFVYWTFVFFGLGRGGGERDGVMGRDEIYCNYRCFWCWAPSLLNPNKIRFLKWGYRFSFCENWTLYSVDLSYNCLLMHMLTISNSNMHAMNCVIKMKVSCQVVTIE